MPSPDDCVRENIREPPHEENDARHLVNEVRERTHVDAGQLVERVADRPDVGSHHPVGNVVEAVLRNGLSRDVHRLMVSKIEEKRMMFSSFWRWSGLSGFMTSRVWEDDDCCQGVDKARRRQGDVRRVVVEAVSWRAIWPNGS